MQTVIMDVVGFLNFSTRDEKGLFESFLSLDCEAKLSPLVVFRKRRRNDARQAYRPSRELIDSHFSNAWSGYRFD
jgi:hypothetical protein